MIYTKDIIAALGWLAFLIAIPVVLAATLEVFS